tara:strand:+ start:120 stop:2534 length:2415 start_codon:yes stop_codon:yes gene_type:complete
MSYSTPYTSNLTNTFNRAWNENTQNERITEETLIANAQMSDKNWTALAGLSKTAGNLLEEKAKKDEIAKRADEQVKFFWDVMYGNTEIPDTTSQEEFEEGLESIDKDHTDLARQAMNDGASYEEARSIKDKGPNIHELKNDVWLGMEGYSRHMGSIFAADGSIANPNKEYIMPGTGGQSFKLGSEDIGIKEVEYARLVEMQRYFEESGLMDMNSTLLLPYMKSMVSNHRAWKKKAEIHIDDRISIKDREKLFSSLSEDRITLSKYIDEVSLTTKNGIPIGYDGAMDIYLEQTLANIKNAPYGTGLATKLYNNALDIGDSIIPEGYKGAGKTYAEEYPQRFGSAYHQKLRKEYLAWSKKNKEWKDVGRQNLIDSIPQEIDQKIAQSTNENPYTIENGVEEIQAHIAELRRNDPTVDVSALEAKIDNLLRPRSEETIINAETILRKAESTDSLALDLHRHLVEDLPSEDQKDWYTKIENQTERRQGEDYKELEKSFKNAFIADNLSVNTGINYLVGDQTAIVLDLEEKFRKKARFYRSKEGGLLSEDQAALQAHTDIMTYMNQQKQEGGLYYQDKTNEGGKGFGQFKNWQNHKKQEFTQIGLDKKFEQELRQALKEVGSTKAILNNPQGVFSRDEIKSWAETYLQGKGIPDRVIIASEVLNTDPINLMQKTLRLNKEQPLDIATPTPGGPLTEVTKYQTPACSSRYISSAISKGENVSNLIPGGFGVYTDDSINPNYTAALMEGSGLFADYIPDDLDAIDLLSQETPNSFLDSLESDDERTHWLGYFWKYQVPGFESCPIRTELLK